MTGADAIHPGYGFLSENADFAEMVEAHNLVWIGPHPEMIRKMGDKVAARSLAKESGLPVIPGSDGAVKSFDEAKRVCDKIGYPVLLKAASGWGEVLGYPVIIKASAGGGGKGMRVVNSADEMEMAFTLAQNEARSAFENDGVYVEKYLRHPSHIEVQILADNYGNMIHLGERDCSLQRNHQKILEETPSPALNPEQREKLGNMVVKAMKKIGYSSVGTIEFLYENGQFYFMEMNTRLQVEHPITEAVTNLDIVREQIRLSAGQTLDIKQEDIQFHGVAIECRINAENPDTFIPCPGKIGQWHVPGGLAVRVDSGMYAGCDVPPNYDSLVAKLIVSGRTRNGALMRLKRALGEFVIEGISTTIPLHQEIIQNADFIDGAYDIHWLEDFLKNREK